MVTLTLDYQSLSYMTVYLLTLHLSSINPRTSTHWRLCEETGEVAPVVGAIPGVRRRETGSEMAMASDEELASEEEARVMHILTGPPGKRWRHGESWIMDSGASEATTSEKDPSKQAASNLVAGHGVEEAGCLACREHQQQQQQATSKHQQNVIHRIRPAGSSQSSADDSSSNEQQSSDRRASDSGGVSKSSGVTLTCEPFVNLTQYDHLRGIEQRSGLPVYPEPEVAAIFRKKSDKPGDLKLTALETKLSQAKTKRPKSPQVYNQIGNFLRILGDSTGATECFRRALFLSPSHPDVLLNLARVLFNHHFLDDAIYLTRRSLETLPPERNSWLQHFTLGEILKAYGHTQEAVFHFRHALDLNPGFAPAQNHLQDLEQQASPGMTYYTFFIILFLVMVVLCGVLTSIDPGVDAEGVKTQRHFNRAMAMKTLKLGINAKARMRRANSSTQTVCPVLNAPGTTNQ